MRSLKSSPTGLKQVREAREMRGLAIYDPQWLEEASNILEPEKNWEHSDSFAVCIGTWKRFLRGTPVKPDSFKAFCQVLKLDWEEVVEIQSVKSKDKSLPISQHDWDGVPDVSVFYDRIKVACC